MLRVQNARNSFQTSTASCEIKSIPATGGTWPFKIATWLATRLFLLLSMNISTVPARGSTQILSLQKEFNRQCQDRRTTSCAVQHCINMDCNRCNTKSSKHAKTRREEHNEPQCPRVPAIENSRDCFNREYMSALRKWLSFKLLKLRQPVITSIIKLVPNFKQGKESTHL